MSIVGTPSKAEILPTLIEEVLNVIEKETNAITYYHLFILLF